MHDTLLLLLKIFIPNLQELPKTMMPCMVNFLKDMECPNVSNSSTSGYGTYLNQHAVDEMNESISTMLEEELLENIRNSTFCSIMLDESTDVSNSKRLVVYIRYINGYVGKTAYISNIELKDGTAESIFKAVHNCLKEKGLQENFSNVVAICTDGANVMVGCRNGVVTKIKEINKKIIGIHCLAHRLALCLSDASKSVSQISKFQDTLKSVFSYYSSSAVRLNRLQEIQDVLDEPMLKYTEPCSVRWLSVSSCVSVVLRTIDSLRAALEHDASLKTGDAAKAKGILKLVSEFSFVALVHIMMDILEPFTMLSKFLQNENLVLSSVTNMIVSTKESLEELQTTRGPHEEKKNSELQGNMFKKNKLTDPCNSQKLGLDNLKSTYISKVIEEMDRRFPPETLAMCSKFQCIEPSAIKANGEKTDFGNTLIKDIVNQFCPEEEIDSAIAEYALFKKVVKNENMLDFGKFSEKFLREYSDTFPIISKIMKVALVLPVTSVPCERGFSTQNRIKSNFRNSLNNKNLDILMRISELGPEKLNETQVLNCHKIWLNMKKRRV